ncbi:hypothetical protein NX794_29410, partial [Streptomyces sp. LP11]|nr:hypothetical protein [Streptomyces sp. LP11]
MSEHGGGSGESPHIEVPRSRLAEYAELATPSQEQTDSPPDDDTPADCRQGASGDSGALPEGTTARARRREFAALLGEFRRTAVLVPLGDGPGPVEERGL